MNNLIPYFIQEQYQAQQRVGDFEAYTLFVDLSGFTALTESLMQEGTAGAERLSNILNEIFSPLVKLMYDRGGFIPYFAGDAFTAIFPKEKMDATTLLQTACIARSYFQGEGNLFDGFRIGIKTGLSYGSVDWGIVGEGYKSFYFRGEAIDGCANSQMQAGEQEIVLDKSLYNILSQDVLLSLEHLDNDYYRLIDYSLVDHKKIEPASREEIDRDVALQFFPKAVVDYNQEGEFRSVASIFISFKGISDHELMNQFASIVIDQLYQFSGYFKEIDFGDKGGVMVGFLGAPLSYEDNVQRALEFVLSLKEEAAILTQTTDLKFRVAVTVGTAYTGVIGGNERSQYACVGNHVNLAARLMSYADWGEILVEEEVGNHPLFFFSHRGNIKYKGIKDEVPTYVLEGHSDGGRKSHYTTNFVARNKELNILTTLTKKVVEEQKGVVSYVFGEAGIGKSRLMFELKKQLSNHHHIHWFKFHCDQILRKAFNPFILFLKNYFAQKTERADKSKNQHNFEERINLLKERINEVNSEESIWILRELERTTPILSVLAGLESTNELWEQLSAQGRYQNTIAAIVNLIVAENLFSPLILEIEDGHWLDASSKDVVNELVKRIGQSSIFLLLTSRYNDDGSTPSLIDINLLKQYEFIPTVLHLKALRDEEVLELGESTLGGKLHPSFLKMLIRASNKNPFYVEQLLEYFVESKLLRKNEQGKWILKDENIRLSNSINSILTARIDRLSTLVKETVKTAAVIGREFEVPVLSEVMKNQQVFLEEEQAKEDKLSQQIKTAERVQIWRAITELRYIFQHSLLRETVYSMQLKRRVSKLHQLIGEAIEKIYAGDLHNRYEDLAFHFEEAGDVNKAITYIEKAGDKARASFHNLKALKYYNKLLVLLEAHRLPIEVMNALTKKGLVSQLIGDFSASQQCFAKALNLAKNESDINNVGQLNNLLGRVFTLQGNYPQAISHLQEATKIFESLNDKQWLGKTYGYIGDVYFRQGDYEDAENTFEKSIAIGDRIELTQVVSSLGLTYMNQGSYNQGIEVQTQQLNIVAAANDKQSMATLYTNLGIVFLEQQNYTQALEHFREGLALSEELGNKMLTSIAIGCMGSVYEKQGDYIKAMELFEQDLKLCEEMGDKQGIAIALGLIGEHLSLRGDFDEAINYLEENLLLCEELGYQKGVAKAVNTLGDVYYFKQKYDKAIYYYNRAIEVTENIDNKLVLGRSLLEKGMVLLELNKIKEITPLVDKALAVAGEIDNNELIFEAELLQIRIKDKKQAQQELENRINSQLSKDEEGILYFYLAEISQEQKYIEKAKTINTSLYEQVPKYVYKHRIMTLQK